MGAVGDPITQPIPAVSTGGTGYATQINAFLTEVKSRLETKLSLSSVLATLLDMAANAIKNVQYLAFSDAGTTPSTPTSSIQSFGGNLFWVSPAGAVQITTGAALNAATLAGITGDYGGANPAQFRFVDADQEYYAYDDFGGLGWAWLGARGLDVFGGYNSAVKAHITWAGAGTINLVLPPSLPAGPGVLFLDNTGAITTTAQPTVALVMGNNTNVKLQGTGYLQSGNFTVTGPFSTHTWNPAGGITFIGTTTAGVVVPNNTTAYYPLNVTHDDLNRVINVKINTKQNGTADSTVSLVSANNGLDSFQGLYSAIAGASTTVTHGAGPVSVTITPSSPFAGVNGTNIWLKVVTPAAGGNTLELYSWSMTQDRP